MHALVVYESMFGNSEKVAQAIATGLRTCGTATVLHVGEAPSVVPSWCDLLVVGGPTHAFSMSTRRSRETAERDGARHTDVPFGIRDWLAVVKLEPNRTNIAVFDTQTTPGRLPGSAGRAAVHLLKRRHYRTVSKPESFHVETESGPVSVEETERARRWGEELADVAPSTGR